MFILFLQEIHKLLIWKKVLNFSYSTHIFIYLDYHFLCYFFLGGVTASHNETNIFKKTVNFNLYRKVMFLEHVMEVNYVFPFLQMETNRPVLIDICLNYKCALDVCSLCNVQCT